MRRVWIFLFLIGMVLSICSGCKRDEPVIEESSPVTEEASTDLEQGEEDVAGESSSDTQDDSDIVEDSKIAWDTEEYRTIYQPVIGALKEVFENIMEEEVFSLEAYQNLLRYTENEYWFENAIGEYKMLLGGAVEMEYPPAIYMIDINEDQIPELVVGNILLLYTVVEDQPIMVLGSWTRNSHYFLEDGTIYEHSSSGASDSQVGCYYLKGGEMIPHYVKGVRSYVMVDGEYVRLESPERFIIEDGVETIFDLESDFSFDEDYEKVGVTELFPDAIVVN